MSTFLVLLVAYVFSQFYRIFLAVIAVDLSRDLHLDAAQLGTLSAAWFVAFAVFQFPVGYGLDRFGPRRTLVVIMLAAVAGAAWLSQARGYADALAAMTLIGIGCAPVLMAGMYLFARLYPPERFATLSTSLIGLSSVGNLLGTSPLVWAAERFGWRHALLAVALLTAGAIALAAAVLRDPPPVDEPAADGRSLLGGLLAVARIRALWLILPLTATGYAVLIAVRALWISPYLAAVHHLSPSLVGQAALAMAAAMSLGALGYGPVERRWGAKRATIGGTAVTIMAVMALAVAGEASPPLAVALLTAIGAFGFTYAILMAHAREFMPAALIGRGVTFMNFAFVGGAGLMQWLSGQVVQLSIDAGVAPEATYGRLFGAFALILAIALAIYACAPDRPLGRDVTPRRAPGP